MPLPPVQAGLQPTARRRSRPNTPSPLLHLWAALPVVCSLPERLLRDPCWLPAPRPTLTWVPAAVPRVEGLWLLLLPPTCRSPHSVTPPRHPANPVTVRRAKSSSKRKKEPRLSACTQKRRGQSAGSKRSLLKEGFKAIMKNKYLEIS